MSERDLWPDDLLNADVSEEDSWARAYSDSVSRNYDLLAQIENANARIARLVEEKNEWIKNEAALVAALDDAEARIAAVAEGMDRFIKGGDVGVGRRVVGLWRSTLLGKGEGE